jgi:hypothetical protein
MLVKKTTKGIQFITEADLKHWGFQEYSFPDKPKVRLWNAKYDGVPIDFEARRIYWLDPDDKATLPEAYCILMFGDGDNGTQFGKEIESYTDFQTILNCIRPC